MNAYAIGQLAGMQKQALSTKGWQRLIKSLKKQAPELFKVKPSKVAPRLSEFDLKYSPWTEAKRKLPGYDYYLDKLKDHERAVQLGFGSSRTMKDRIIESLGPESWDRSYKQFATMQPTLREHVGSKLTKTFPALKDSVRTSFSHGKPLAHAADVLPALQTVSRAVEAGKPLSGTRTQQMLKQLEDLLGLGKPLDVSLQQLKSKAVKLPGTVPGQATWRGLNIGKSKMPKDTPIWWSGERDVGTMYALAGGEGAKSQAGKLLFLGKKRRGLPFRQHPVGRMKGFMQRPIEQRKRGLSPHKYSPYYETIVPAPEDPLGDVSKAWRVHTQRPLRAGWSRRHEFVLDPKTMQLRKRKWQPAIQSPHYTQLEKGREWTAAERMADVNTVFTPISKASLRKWMKAQEAPSIIGDPLDDLLLRERT